MKPRRMDTEAIDVLIANAHGGKPDVAYLVAALEHYREMYAVLLAEREEIEANARALKFNYWDAIEPRGKR